MCILIYGFTQMRETTNEDKQRSFYTHGPMFLFGRRLWIAKRVCRIICYVASWALLLFIAGLVTYDSWTAYDSDEYDAGTEGHATVDFGGQWYVGKLILQGEGHYLYERHHLWMVMQENFPAETQPSSPDVAQAWRIRDGLKERKWSKDDHAMRLLRPYLTVVKDTSGKETDKFKDEQAAELLGRYLLPIGQDNPLAVANTLTEIEAKFGSARQDFYVAYKGRQTFAGNLMGWLLGWDDAEDQKTRCSCLLPMATQDPLGAIALTAAAREECWTPKAIDNASQRRWGGQVYPPIHAFLYVPFALLEPVAAYRAAILLPLPLALLAGWGLKKITGLWLPLGTLLCIWIPGFDAAQCLGHNGSIIVALLVWGYYLLQKGYDVRGGLVWGLFAFKPSWAVTYFVMLLVSRRWRAALAMGICGMTQILLTIPFVGVQSWLDWRAVIASANDGYGEYYNWVWHSRDMQAMARRLLNDFEAPFGQRDRFESRLIGFMLMGFILEVTVRLTTLRGRAARRWSYAAGAFLLLGFWMITYHITYYDAMFTTLPLALLLFVPAPLLVPWYFQRRRLEWYGTGPAKGWKLSLPAGRYGIICNPLIAILLPVVIWNLIGVTLPEEFVEALWYEPRHFLFGTEIPQTIKPYFLNVPFIVPSFMLLWVWSGWMWLREPMPVEKEVAEPSAGAGEPVVAQSPDIERPYQNADATLARSSELR
jgi:hypothetical protein